MASMRHIKTRIKSVGSTQQITKAMNLVSSSKLQRVKQKLQNTRPFFDETRRVIASIVNNSKGIKHPYLEEREVKNTLMILMTADRGLCGGYNSNINKEALKITKDKNTSMIIVGTKGRDFFKKYNVKTIANFNKTSDDPIYSENPTYEDAAKIATIALELFKKGEIDEVYLAYTEFKSTLSHIPKAVKILPVDTSEFLSGDSEKNLSLMQYEPNEEAVLDYIIPKYLNTIIFGALVESSACEQGARMTSMDSATENAEQMISNLTLLYNRARQSAITQEITEIVGGANALE